MTIVFGVVWRVYVMVLIALIGWLIAYFMRPTMADLCGACWPGTMQVLFEAFMFITCTGLIIGLIIYWLMQASDRDIENQRKKREANE